ncbi:hypothetical protein LguiA_021906 [Lonicera macranthoides]
MYFDGACNRNGNGIEILLISLDQTHAPMSFRLEFPFTNNITEYEACIVGLKIALQKGVRKIQVFGDSALIIHQIMTKWKIKEEKLVPFLAQLEETSEKFDCIEFFYIPRTQNNFANALATLASMIEIPGEKEEIQIQIQKRANSVFCLSLDVESGNVVEPSVWYYDICHLLKHNEYPPNTNKATRVALRRLASRFIICAGKLYRRNDDGIHLQCLDEEKSRAMIEQIHSGECGPHMSSHTLARKIVR